MAGFFGLFNYEKEGPGISKNAPKKKTFVVFFETFFRNFWKFITINLVYSLISLPVVTGGLANVGLTHVARNTARDKHSFGLSDFFETIRKNFKQGLIMGIINAVVYALILFDAYFFFINEGTFSIIGVGISCSILLIFTMMNYFIWTLIITFKFSLKQVIRNSFKFVFINFKNNLICFFSLALVYAVNIGLLFLLQKYFLFVLTLELLIYLLTFPGFKFLLVQYCVFPSIKKYIIDPYYLEHPDEDIEKRRDLGIEVEEKKTVSETEEGEEEDDDIVFED